MEPGYQKTAIFTKCDKIVFDKSNQIPGLRMLKPTQSDQIQRNLRADLKADQITSGSSDYPFGKEGDYLSLQIDNISTSGRILIV